MILPNAYATNTGVIVTIIPHRIKGKPAEIKASTTFSPAPKPTDAMNIAKPKFISKFRAATGILPKVGLTELKKPITMPEISSPPALPKPSDKLPNLINTDPSSKPATIPNAKVTKSVCSTSPSI